jgi:hypothetical protein
VVISVLVVALIYSPSSIFSVPNRSNDAGVDCEPTGKQSKNGLALVECCWFEWVTPGTGIDGGNQEEYCSTCEDGGTRGKINCSDPELQFFVGSTPGLGVLPENGVLEQLPTPPSSGPIGPLQGGVLEQLEQGEGFSPGFLQRQQEQPPPADQGAAELPPPTSEGTQPAPVEEEPVPPCPEGQVLDEETGLCILEEPEAAEQEPEQSEAEEQPSEESDSGDDSNN